MCVEKPKVSLTTVCEYGNFSKEEIFPVLVNGRYKGLAYSREKHGTYIEIVKSIEYLFDSRIEKELYHNNSNGCLHTYYYITSENKPDKIETIWSITPVPIKQVPFDNERIAYQSIQKNYDYNRMMDRLIKYTPSNTNGLNTII